LTREPFGTNEAGDAVELVTLRGGGLVARVTNHGATLVELHVPDRDGTDADVVCGFGSVEGYLSDGNPYFGATVGRVANRIAHGRFTIDGTAYVLATNETPHHLHGGERRSFDKVVWEVVEVEVDRATFRYVSPAGEEGYPGTVEALATYRLEDAELVIEYRASTDATTPINMTNHAYFNLAGAGRGDILDHELTIAAEATSEVDDELIPSGADVPVAGTALDFRTPRRVGERIEELREVPGALGYDHNYVLGDATGEVRRAAVLHDPSSGRVMEIATNQPCVQFYSGNRMDDPIAGKQGQVYGLHGALCLEPQFHPDAVNQPRFPSTLLEPGATYEHRSHYRFTAR
jgi:aldose 1-epimerase